jgi:hypothetical protein
MPPSLYLHDAVFADPRSAEGTTVSKGGILNIHVREWV